GLSFLSSAPSARHASTRTRTPPTMRLMLSPPFNVPSIPRRRLRDVNLHRKAYRKAEQQESGTVEDLAGRSPFPAIRRDLAQYVSSGCKSARSTSSGAGRYLYGSIEEDARPWLRLRTLSA